MAAYRCFAKFCYVPTAEALAAFGSRLEGIATEAFRAIALARKGFEIAHLQFRSGANVIAVSSRVRSYGEIEIEIDVGNPSLPTVVFSEDELRKSNRHAPKQARSTPKRSARTMFHLTR
jgi:hypothetical protein